MNTKKIFESDREFKFLDYSLSHPRLLLRSFSTKGFNTNIDIIFFGVVYIELGITFEGISINRNELPTQHHETLKPVFELGSSEFEIKTKNDSFLIVAYGLLVYENSLEMLKSSLGHGYGEDMDIGKLLTEYPLRKPKL